MTIIVDHLLLISLVIVSLPLVTCAMLLEIRDILEAIRIHSSSVVLLNRGASGRDFILRYTEGEIFPLAVDICRPITSPVFPAPSVFPK